MEKITLKNLEERLIKEGKSGYVKVRIYENEIIKCFRIGYFKDCAKWEIIDYDTHLVDFIKYVGWDK